MLGKALARQFHFSMFALQKNLDGVTHEESLRPPPRGGNCLNWIVGHVVHARNHVLRMVGEEPLWEVGQGSVYARGSSLSNPEDAISLDALRDVLERSQKSITEALAAKSAEDLSVALPDPSELLGDTIGTALTTLAFHEAYHVGQTGLLRRVLGHVGAIG